LSILRILNTNLSLINFDELKKNVIQTVTINSVTNIIACDFRQILYFRKIRLSIDNTFFYPDSSGIYFILKIIYHRYSNSFKRLVSTDFHYSLLEIGEKNKYKFYFLGDTTDTLSRFREKILEKYPQLEIVGLSNGYEDLNSKNLITQINDSGADILLIGLGVPKQEEWLIKNSTFLNVSVRITVGAFFTFYSGKIKRAPKLMRKLYLEWLFRFIHEPKRLFERYVIEFPKTFYLVFLEKWRKKN